jgi:serine/threonine protein kinase
VASESSIESSRKVSISADNYITADKNIYALKEIPFQDKRELESAFQEKQLMSKVGHKNICRYVDSFIINGSRLCLIMEYCEKGKNFISDLEGDLARYLDRNRKMNGIVKSK